MSRENKRTREWACTWRSSCVVRTVARARGGEGPPWGFTVIPLVGDTCRAMQPQVSLTSGRAHTRAAPGDAPGYHMLCMYVVLWTVPMRVSVSWGYMGMGRAHTTSASDPQSIDREVIHAQCCHTSIISASEHVRCLSPYPHLGTVQPHLGTRPARVQPHLGTQ